ncbi:MAG TPA: CoA transferase, partial [Methylomirabilota bacterium]|nr:CoA transferase [Methylomirabilota bacterium]
MRDAAGPLSDLVILDLTRVLAGPYGTRLLADLGARVIKIERPRDGDDMRKNHLQLEPGRADQSTYFIRINAGKESVAVDLSHPQGRAVVTDICRVADVFVENFAPGVVEKLGLGYAAMAAVKPDLVYCSISGFGQTGPWR